jgi:hypothetical protein
MIKAAPLISAKINNATCRTLLASLQDGMQLRMAGGLQCVHCQAAVPCDPEPLEDGGFRIVCRSCHRDLLIYRRRA